MPVTSWDYSPGRFVLSDDHNEWSIDRGSRHVHVVQRSALFRNAERTFPLDDLLGVTLQLAPAPPMTAAAAMRVLSTAYDAYRKGVSNPDALAAEVPKGLTVRLDERASGALPRETTMTFAVHGLDAHRDLVMLAYRIAEAADFSDAGVFSIPHTGIEVRLARGREPGLQPLPASQDAAAADDALARARMPPFEAHRFLSDHAVVEWKPGARVLFRRRFSLWAVAVFPFTLLLLTGPAIVVAALATGRGLNVVNTLILTVVSAAFGIPALALFLAMLPRAIDFDWTAHTLSIRRWPRRRSLSLDRILGLEAHPRFQDSSNGDSGGSPRTFACELKARVDERDGAGPRLIDLLETTSHSDPAVPTRQAFPLASELAAALRVECRTEDYSFRHSREKTRTKKRR